MNMPNIHITEEMETERISDTILFWFSVLGLFHWCFMAGNDTLMKTATTFTNQRFAFALAHSIKMKWDSMLQHFSRYGLCWLNHFYLRLVQGIVTMHCTRTYANSSLIPRAKAARLDVLCAQARLHCDNKTQEIGRILDYNMTCLISPGDVNIPQLRDEYGVRSENQFACWSHCYVTWCPFTTGIIVSHCPSSRDAMVATRLTAGICS